MATEDYVLLMEDALSEINDQIDTKVGPVPDLFLYPAASAMADVSDKVESIRDLLSSRFAEVATATEALMFAENFGVGSSPGHYAKGNLTFFRYTAPSVGQTVTVEAGSVVTRKADGATYQTTESASMTGDSAAAYYNRRMGRYELTIPSRATLVGPEYDAKASTVDALMYPIAGFDGAVNTSDFTGGSLAETPYETVKRAQTAMLGTARGTYGGIVQQVYFSAAQQNLLVRDVSIALYNEQGVFQRGSVYRPALDVHILGSSLAVVSELHTATDLQTEFVLRRSPVKSVSSVVRNGGSVTFSLSLDSTQELKGSALERSKIVLVNPAQMGDVVEVTYVYNALVYQIHKALTDNSTSLFGVDTLVREPVIAGIEAQIAVQRQSSSLSLSVLETAIRNFCEPEAFGVTLDPDALSRRLRTVPGVSDVSILAFKRIDTPSQAVNVIAMSKVEIPRFTTNGLVVL